MWWGNNAKFERFAVEVVKHSLGGISEHDLLHRLASRFPNARKESLSKAISSIDIHWLKDIARFDCNLLVPIKLDASRSLLPKEHNAYITADKANDHDEREYYGPLKSFISEELSLHNSIYEFGGNVMPEGHWWTNPDLLGAVRPQPAARPFVQPEIISVEVKSKIGIPDNANSYVNNREKLFGAYSQALSYRLFSHRVIISVPEIPNIVQKSLFERRCSFYGIGLIYFSGPPESPAFRWRLHPTSSMPDVQTLNDFMSIIERAKPEIYKNLFS